MAVRWYRWLEGQLWGAVAQPSHDALGQQVGQGAVHSRVRLAEKERQFRRIDEGSPAEGIEH